MIATDSSVQTALSFVEAFNSADFSIWRSKLAQDFTADYPLAPGLTADQAEQFNASFLPAFPDLHFTVDRVTAGENRMTIEWIATGTHNGPLPTATGQVIPPTGRSARIAGVLITDVRDGSIVRERTYWNQLELLAQLGVL